MRFVGNLILSTRCDFCYDDLTVTSFINIKRCHRNYLVMYSELLCLFSGQKDNANQIHFEMHPVSWRKVLYNANILHLVQDNARWAKICIRY